MKKVGTNSPSLSARIKIKSPFISLRPSLGFDSEIKKSSSISTKLSSIVFTVTIARVCPGKNVIVLPMLVKSSGAVNENRNLKSTYRFWKEVYIMTQLPVARASSVLTNTDTLYEAGGLKSIARFTA